MSPACAAGAGTSATSDRLDLLTATLRITPCDADAARAIARIAADPRVGMPYSVGRCAAGAGAEDAAHWLQGPDDWTSARRLRLAVRLHDGQPVGALQFVGQELGYFLAPSTWRQGLGREMVAAVCRHYPPLLGLARVHASVLRDNVASRRVLEAAGFVFAGLATRRWRGMPGMATMLYYERRAGR